MKMSGHYKIGHNLSQGSLIFSIESLIAENSVARFILAYINSLNLAELGFDMETKNIGQRGYSPADMLKIYFYGYINSVRSSRRLAWQCRVNAELMWLIDGLTPDFRTIADFRKENAVAFKKVFRDFVRKLKKMGELDLSIVSMDGTKIKAMNNRSKVTFAADLQETIEEIDSKIAQFLLELDKNDSEEKSDSERTPEELQAMLAILESRKSELMATLEAMNGEKQICHTDPECKLMKQPGGNFDCSFNVQTAVDMNHYVVAFEETDKCNDVELVENDFNMVKETLEVESVVGAMDKGYRNSEQILNALLDGNEPNVYLNDKQDCYSWEFEGTTSEITDEMRNSTKPEVIKQVIAAGEIPEILKEKVKNGTIEIEVNDTFEEIKFERDSEKNIVTCPHGRRMESIITNEDGSEGFYRNCRKCDVAYCELFYSYSWLKGLVPFASKQTEIVLKRKLKSRKVVLKFHPNYQKLAVRGSHVEHPYGTIKQWCDGRYTLLKGKLKAGADLALEFLSYNVKHLIKRVGIGKAIEMITA